MLNFVRLAPVKWAQRKDRLYLSIGLRDIKDEKVNVEAEKFSFTGTSDGKVYKFEIDLFAEVLPEETVKRNYGLQLELQIIKKDQDQSYWPRITKETVKMINLKVDWDRYCDSDEED